MAEFTSWLRSWGAAADVHEDERRAAVRLLEVA